MLIMKTRAENQSRRNGIDADAVFTELRGKRASPGQHRAFGGGVDQRTRMAARAPGQGGQVNNTGAVWRGLQPR